MQSKSPDLKTRIKQFFTRLMVRLKRVDRVAVELDEIVELVNQPLPVVFPITTPGSEGELSILGVDVSIAPCSNDTNRECLHAEILCNFSVKVKQSVIYNTHLMLLVEAQPNYCINDKSIGIAEPKVADLQLISDEYSIIKDTTSLISGLLPKSLKPIVDMTLFSTKALFNTKTASKAVKYLSLYTSGSKQKVFDYHRAEIEDKIAQLTRNNSMSYRLNEAVFEEKLFADFGEEIVLESGKLYFVFKR